MADVQHFAVGGPGRRQGPSQVSVRLVRAIVMGGQRIEVDTQLQLAPAFAGELIAAGKAVREVQAPAAKPKRVAEAV